MKIKKVEARAGLSRGQITRAAAKLFRNKAKNPLLVGWYDRKRQTGGPMEACGDEPYRCAVSYARSRGADICIVVNDHDYELFYRRTPPDAVELDREACLAIHSELEMNRFENVQGG
jgi:hypothetical protein